MQRIPSWERNQKDDFEQTTQSVRTLSMIGMGMGGGKQLTLEALEVLKHSDIVFGASRMLNDLAPWIRKYIRKLITSRKRSWTGWKNIQPVSMR